MKEYKIAHIREQGQDIIIIPLGNDFSRLPDNKKIEQKDQLQECASSANLAGIVVPVWMVGLACNFIAPEPWHPYFCSITWNDIISKLNKTLTCR